jgi:hypothetical protein
MQRRPRPHTARRAAAAWHAARRQARRQPGCADFVGWPRASVAHPRVQRFEQRLYSSEISIQQRALEHDCKASPRRTLGQLLTRKPTSHAAGRLTAVMPTQAHAKNTCTGTCACVHQQYRRSTGWGRCACAHDPVVADRPPHSPACAPAGAACGMHLKHVPPTCGSMGSPWRLGRAASWRTPQTTR